MKKTVNVSNEWSSKRVHSCMQPKGFINGGGEWNKHTRHNCMQSKGFVKDGLSDDEFSLKVFVTQIILGIIGGSGIWYLSPSFELMIIEEAIEPLKFCLFLLSVVFVIAGIFGIYDLIKKQLGL